MAVPLAGKPEIEERYGLSLQNLTTDLSDYLAYNSTKGVFVAGIRKNSRAEQDGVEMGDIIVAIENQPVADLESMRRQLDAGTGAVGARIYRQNEYITLTLHLE
jgi:S1-C subfamily serine protease